MKHYRNSNTGKILTLEEIKRDYEYSKSGSEYMSSFDSFDAYLEDQLARGKSGGLTPIWFAVTSDNYDSWDNGSFDLNETMKMLREQGSGSIAVIDESDNFCLAEIHIENMKG